jgi:hypothetical protein
MAGDKARFGSVGLFGVECCDVVGLIGVNGHDVVV